MVCYYGSWAVYRPGNGKFDVEHIDPFLCTHIIYGFTGLGTDNTMIPLDPWNDLYDNWGKGAFLRFTGLKRQNPNLKALIAIGLVILKNKHIHVIHWKLQVLMPVTFSYLQWMERRIWKIFEGKFLAVNVHELFRDFQWMVSLFPDGGWSSEKSHFCELGG